MTVAQHLPHSEFNLIAIIISFLVLLWGWSAFRRFYQVLNYRLAVLTDNTVMLRGIGENLDQFSGASPSHARSILHTRSVEANINIQFLYVPFRIVHPIKINNNLSQKDPQTSNRNSHNISSSSNKSNNSNMNFFNRNFALHPVNPYEIIPKSTTNLCGYIPIWCAVDCTILVLYELDIERVMRFFKHSMKANRLFAKGSKYRTTKGLEHEDIIKSYHTSTSAGLSKSDQSDKKTSKLKKSKASSSSSSKSDTKEQHVYAERLIRLFIKKDLCLAYSSFETLKSVDASQADEGVYHVPIHDTVVSVNSMLDVSNNINHHAYEITDNDINPEELNENATSGIPVIISPSGHSQVPASKLSPLQHSRTLSPAALSSSSSSSSSSSASSTINNRLDVTAFGEVNSHPATLRRVAGSSSSSGGTGRNSGSRRLDNRCNNNNNPQHTDNPSSTEMSDFNLQNTAPYARQHIGILIIPKDLPYMGSPEHIALLPSASHSRAGEDNALSDDIELGTIRRLSDVDQAKYTSEGLVDKGKYTYLDFGLQVLEPSMEVKEGVIQNTYSLSELFVHASGTMCSSNEIYGLQSPDINVDSNKEDNDNQTPEMKDEAVSECVICLTEKQEIFLLPCRHLCVCKDCFPHIDKCPVCRSLFDDFVTVQKDRLILVKAPTCTRRKLSTSLTSIKIEDEVNEKSSQSVKLKSL